MDYKVILLMVLITFIFVSIINPFIMQIAIHVNALDIPDKRKVHNKPMPRLGGLGIYSGFLFGYMLFCKESLMMNSIFIGSFIIVVTGIIDDIKPIRARYKFLGQVIAACVVSIYGGLLLRDVSAFGIYINFGIFTYPVTILFIVGIINCINFLDGLDGLAAGICSIYFLTVGILAVMFNNSTGLDTILSFILLGSTLGFLVHNFNPAKIFMGDSGSMFLGYIISIIALLGYKNITFTSLLVPVFLLAIPILDTLFAILRRILKHQPISSPDKSHFHHQLLKLKFSTKKTVIIIYCVDLLFALASIFYVLGDFVFGLIVYSILLFLIIILIVKTDIIVKK